MEHTHIIKAPPPHDLTPRLKEFIRAFAALTPEEQNLVVIGFAIMGAGKLLEWLGEHA